MKIFLTEYFEYLDYITVPGVKRAFEYFIKSILDDGRFEIIKAPHGYIKNLTFVTERTRPYALVPAKRWLTLYLRTPHTTHPGLNLETLRSQFQEAALAHRNELKVVFRSEADAGALIELMGIGGKSNLYLPK
jgi:hypothetical protein